MKHTMRPLFTLICSVLAISCGAQTDPEYWVFDNLQQIGGHPVTVIGDPSVVDTPEGKAVHFDGEGDQLVVEHNPIGAATSFTVEVLFKPDACYPDHTDPRFIHIQDPDDPRAKRLMIELRINEQNRCYLDAFIKTDTSDLVLIDESLTHPTEEWLHAAVVFDQGLMTTYFNGVKELAGRVGYDRQIINPVGKVA
ncbi:MAG: LamG-like jellyroll fold domain-containing protein, partial [Bacteroidales bacterium]